MLKFKVICGINSQPLATWVLTLPGTAVAGRGRLRRARRSSDPLVHCLLKSLHKVILKKKERATVNLVVYVTFVVNREGVVLNPRLPFAMAVVPWEIANCG